MYFDPLASHLTDTNQNHWRRPVEWLSATRGMLRAPFLAWDAIPDGTSSEWTVVSRRGHEARGKVGHGRLDKEPTKAAELGGVLELAFERTGAPVERVLDTARKTLGMDVAFVAEFADEEIVLRALSGDAGPFGWREDARIPSSTRAWRWRSWTSRRSSTSCRRRRGSA